MYNKLYTKILDSSVWLEPHPTRIVWITLLAAMDEDGFAQFSSVRNLANRAMVTPEEAEKAVATLEAPDAESGIKAHEGRRIERVDGGWIVMNAGTYRDVVTRAERQRMNRERVARFRAKKAGNAVCNAPVMQSESDTDAVSESKKNTLARKSRRVSKPDPQFDEIRAAYPKRAGGDRLQGALSAYRARLREGATHEMILNGVRRYAAFCEATDKVGTPYVQQLATFLGTNRSYLELWNPPPKAETPAERRQRETKEKMAAWAKGEANASQ